MNLERCSEKIRSAHPRKVNQEGSTFPTGTTFLGNLLIYINMIEGKIIKTHLIPALPSSFFQLVANSAHLLASDYSSSPRKHFISFSLSFPCLNYVTYSPNSYDALELITIFALCLFAHLSLNSRKKRIVPFFLI